jgi:hypothetical protein
VSVVRFQVQVSASGISLVRRSPTERGVSEGDREAAIMRRPCSNKGCCAMESKKEVLRFCVFISILRPNLRTQLVGKMNYFYERMYRLLSL